MASLKDLEGKWRLVESHGFEDYMKELGVGLALRKMGAMAKPDCIITLDSNNLTVKTESTVKTTVFSCTLGEKFDETTADGRKTETVCTFTDGALVQHQKWEGKESTITRKLKDGKMVVECVMNNAICTRDGKARRGRWLGGGGVTRGRRTTPPRVLQPPGSSVRRIPGPREPDTRRRALPPASPLPPLPVGWRKGGRSRGPGRPSHGA
ncbi:lipocalin/fatty-acid binding family protein, partial [Vibrio parahaemolyticus]|nr:lipocalin/fatty-acid binding family protein [Vibrio parahaemolyticus]